MDVGSPASVKNILGEYLSGGCDSLSDLRGMTGLVTPGVDVGWFEAEPFGGAWIQRVLESSDSCVLRFRSAPDYKVLYIHV